MGRSNMYQHCEQWRCQVRAWQFGYAMQTSLSISLWGVIVLCPIYLTLNTEIYL